MINKTSGMKQANEIVLETLKSFTVMPNTFIPLDYDDVYPESMESMVKQDMLKEGYDISNKEDIKKFWSSKLD
jgi:hypothetical protein